MPKIQEPELGLIIVDDYSLSQISQIAAEEYRIHPVEMPRYADGLTLLARHDPAGRDYGFRVMIPEITALKTARIVHNGRSADECFSTPNKSERFFRALYADARIFLTGVAVSGNPNISIEPPDMSATSKAANHIRSTKKLMDNGELCGTTEGLKELNRQLWLPENIDFPAQAAEDILKSLPPSWSKPIFFLSDNSKFSKRLKDANPKLTIVQVSTKGYLEALRENGLLEPLSITIADKTAVDQIGNTLNETAIRRVDKLAVTGSIPITDNTISIEQNGKAPGAPKTEQTKLFMKTVAQVKDRILEDWKKKNEPDATGNELTTEQQASVDARIRQHREETLARRGLARRGMSGATGKF